MYSKRIHPAIALILLFVSVTPACAKDPDYSAPLHVEGATTVSVDEAKWLYDDGAIFIDTRNPRYYARRHIPGSHHLDMKDGFTKGALEAVANKDQPIVIYSSGEHCARGYRGTVFAVSWGYKKVYFFRGGFVDWRDVDLPLESSKP
ncbi:MAG: rhodanese-like domain-containing protein [Gammaproteobacteria bacterium]|nr:rhodanese-like domain-containing protein [Gammaproteobacteria bacterium]